jgi:hypothetical protein
MQSRRGLVDLSHSWHEVFIFLNTVDVIILSRVSKGFKDVCCCFVGYKPPTSDRGVEICINSEHPRFLYIHPFVKGWSDLQVLLSKVDKLMLKLDSVRYVSPISNLILCRVRSCAELEGLSLFLSSDLPPASFSQHKRIVCHFYFPTGTSPISETVFSNSIEIPGGSVSLVRRTLPLIQSDEATACVLGVRLSSQHIWIVRVTSIPCSRRIELMAGCTRADILRVPNGSKGTWTDLLPIPADFGANPELFLVEFM